MCVMCKRASAMITAAIRFVRTFETDRLSPEVYHARPKPDWFDEVMTKIPPGYTGIKPEAKSMHTEVANRCGAYLLDMSQLKSMFRSKCFSQIKYIQIRPKSHNAGDFP